MIFHINNLVQYKNTKAIIPFKERMAIVESINYVDKVVLQENMNKIEAWEKYKFNVMFVGSDWKGTDKWIEYENKFGALGVDIVYFQYTQGTSSTKLRNILDRIMNDEVRASEGIEYLYKNKFSEYVLNKILSVGVLGLKKNKRLVPTRWSITATDDIIGKTLLKNVRDYKLIEDYEFFFGEFLGNQYLILLFPGVWSYELVEFYSPGSSWNPSNEMKASVDYESYSGRKSYAFATAGGYYATRLPILEYLNKRKRQAGVLVLRIETPSYWAGLGVWVVRESVRKALKKGRMKFASREELVEGAKKIGKIKFDFDYEDIFRRSKLLREGKEQKRLVEWV